MRTLCESGHLALFVHTVSVSELAWAVFAPLLMMMCAVHGRARPYVCVHMNATAVALAPANINKTHSGGIMSSTTQNQFVCRKMHFNT